MVKKFKNGNVRIFSPYFMRDYYSVDCLRGNIDRLYNEFITMQDLYFNQINGYMYLVDFNRGRVYDCTYLLGPGNPLPALDNELKKASYLTLHPLTVRESKSLMQDLERGF